MAATFPGGIKTFATLVDGVDEVLATHPNSRGDEITAIETAMGTTGNFNFLPLDAGQFLAKDSLVLSVYDTVTSAIGVGPKVDFLANNNAGTSKQFGQIRTETVNVAAAAEAGELILAASKAGALVDAITIGESNIKIEDDIFVTTGNDVGLGVETALSTLHIVGSSLSLEAGDITSDVLIIEDTDAVLGLYSSDGGAAGSEIVLGEIAAAAFVNSWSFVRTTGSDPDLRFNFGTNTNPFSNATRLLLESDGDVKVGTGAVSAQLHVDQAESGGSQPVLLLDQADVSEEMIEFATTIGTGNAIEAVGAKTLTVTHFIKVTIPGSLTRYFEVGTIA